MKINCYVFFCLLITVLSCNDNFENESVLLTNYIGNLDRNVELSDYKAVLIIPVSRCSSCVSVAAKFAKDNHLEMKKMLIIFNEIRSTKELRLRYDLSPARNVLYDTENAFLESNLTFGNVGFYHIKNAKIIHKEIVNSMNVRERLESLRSLM